MKNPELEIVQMESLTAGNRTFFYIAGYPGTLLEPLSDCTKSYDFKTRRDLDEFLAEARAG